MLRFLLIVMFAAIALSACGGMFSQFDQARVSVGEASTDDFATAPVEDPTQDPTAPTSEVPPAESSVTDLAALKPFLQSRELLRIPLSGAWLEESTGYRLHHPLLGVDLYDSLASDAASRFAAVKPFSRADGSLLLGIKLSPLGSLQNFVYGENNLSLQHSEGESLAEISITIRDFTLFETEVVTSFSEPRQMAEGGFQAWTSVLANPVVSDRQEGQTLLTQGALNIINP